MQAAVAATYRSHRHAVDTAFRTVYFMGKKNLANDLFADLKLFLLRQVSIVQCGWEKPKQFNCIMGLEIYMNRAELSVDMTTELKYFATQAQVNSTFTATEVLVSLHTSTVCVCMDFGFVVHSFVCKCELFTLILLTCRKLLQLLYIDQELLELLQAAPYYSLMVDESTDISTSQTIILYVQFVQEGMVTTQFLELTGLPGGKAEQILDTVLDVLE